MRAALVASMILIGLGTAVRADTVALHADFDLDAVGEAPNSDPPGEPGGDLINIRTQGGPITVEAAVGGISGQPVLMDRQESGYFSIEARLDEDYWFCNSYTVRWRSASMNNLYFFSCSAYAPNTQLLAGIEYRQGYVLSFNGSGNPLPVNFAVGVMQEFEFTLDMVNKTVSLSVDGVALPDFQDLPQYQHGGDGMKALWFSPGGLDPSQFVVDDIEVSANCENTAVVPVTWSRLKSLYR
jgi:hypothetical protein